MAVWAPYRYVSSGFIADVVPENPLLMFIESVVKLSASFGLVYLFLRLYGDSWWDVGIKRDWAGASLLLALIGSSLFVLPHLLLDGRLSPNPLGVAHLLLVVGPAEEIVDRGYFYGMIRSDLEGMRGLFFAALVSSLYFAIEHIPVDLWVKRYDPWQTSVHLLLAFLVGLIFAAYYEAGEGNLIGPSLVHAMVDIVGVYMILPDETSYLIASLLGFTFLMAVPISFALGRRLRGQHP